MHILYATDGSEGAQAAAQWLARLPLYPDDQVTILTVTAYDGADGQAVLNPAHEALCHSAAGTRTQVRVGNPAEEILRAAEEQPTDLLVVGSRGLNAIARFFLGSVAERVARYASCPVLLIRPLQGEVRRVLVGIDGSKDSLQAVEWLRTSPLPSGVELRFVTVLPFLEDLIRAQMFLPLHSAGYREAVVSAERQEREARARLDALAASFSTSGRAAVAEIRQGDPAATLLEAAEAHGADLIVVGSQGLSAIERFIMGSVSEKVLRHAPCSVLVVR